MPTRKQAPLSLWTASPCLAVLHAWVVLPKAFEGTYEHDSHIRIPVGSGPQTATSWHLTSNSLRLLLSSCASASTVHCTEEAWAHFIVAAVGRTLAGNMLRTGTVAGTTRSSEGSAAGSRRIQATTARRSLRLLGNESRAVTSKLDTRWPQQDSWGLQASQQELLASQPISAQRLRLS